MQSTNNYLLSIIMDQRVNDCLAARDNQQHKNCVDPGSYKINDDPPNFLKFVILLVESLGDHLAYFSIVKILIGLLVAKLATTSSRLNT